LVPRRAPSPSQDATLSSLWLRCGLRAGEQRWRKRWDRRLDHPQLARGKVAPFGGGHRCVSDSSLVARRAPNALALALVLDEPLERITGVLTDHGDC
jgi:hypothetical protein